MSKDIENNKREISKERKKYIYYNIFSRIISFIIFFVIIYFIYDVILWKKIYNSFFTKSVVAHNEKNIDLPSVIGDININQSDKENLIKFINVSNSKNIKITQIEKSESGGYKLLTDKNYYIILNNLKDTDITINNFVNIYVDDNIQKLLSSNKLSYIDMSYKDKIYYRTKEQVNIDDNNNLKIKPSDILITSTTTTLTNRH